MKNFFNYPIFLIMSSIENLGRYFLLVFLSIKTINQWRDNLTNILNQMISIGIKSVPIVIFTSLFSGMVAGVQAAYQFDVDTGFPVTAETIRYLGSVVGTSVVLELGPMITALVMTGKIGATISAEIGTMRVTEQIDALEALSFNPIAYLVMPRILAATFMFPFLVIIADFFGIIGGLVASTTAYEPLTVSMFFEGISIYGRIEVDSMLGLIKALFFGFSIASIACYKGYYAIGGASGVGKATTSTVVVSCIAIVILDYILAALLL